MAGHWEGDSGAPLRRCGPEGTAVGSFAAAPLKLRQLDLESQEGPEYPDNDGRVGTVSRSMPVRQDEEMEARNRRLNTSEVPPEYL